MKHRLTVLLVALTCMAASAQTKWHDAADLTVIGKPIPTAKPFARINTAVYKFNDKTIDRYANYSTGLAVLFETDSRSIKAKWTTGSANSGANMAAIGQKGLDLYIMRDGKWVFAGTGSPKMGMAPFNQHEGTIVADMAEGAKQCLLYLPLFDRVDALEIGLDEGASLKPIDNPFRYNIIVHGSSITHGASASRPGMTYPTWNPGKPLEVTVGDVSGVYCDSDDYVYFNDNHSTRVQVLIPGVGNDPTKGLIRTFNATASPGTFGTQGSITKDSNGNFYVASKNKHKIVKMIPKN